MKRVDDVRCKGQEKEIKSESERELCRQKQKRERDKELLRARSR
jgi:hypothetical protein